MTNNKHETIVIDAGKDPSGEVRLIDVRLSKDKSAMYLVIFRAKKKSLKRGEPYTRDDIDYEQPSVSLRFVNLRAIDVWLKTLTEAKESWRRIE